MSSDITRDEESCGPIGGPLRRSRISENRVCPTPAPLNMTRALLDRLAIRERCSSIGCPRHLEHSAGPLHSFDPQSGTEVFPCSCFDSTQVGDECLENGQKPLLVLRIQPREIATKRVGFIMGWHCGGLYPLLQGGQELLRTRVAGKPPRREIAFGIGSIIFFRRSSR